MRQLITLFEHEARTVRLPPSLAALLARAAGDRLALDVRGAGLFRLRAFSYVGVLSAGGVTIQVLPKMARPTLSMSDQETDAAGNLLFLLRYTRTVDVAATGLASLLSRRVGLLEVFIRLFASDLLGLLRNGVYHEYREREERGSLVRGRLQLTKQARTSPAERHLLHLVHDEFTADCPLNQLFLFVTELLLRQTDMVDNRRMLLLLRTLLEGVGPASFDAAAASRIRVTRLNQRFEPALDFCRRLLSGLMPDPSPGGSDCFTFLFDMNVLFERFIGEFLRRNFTAQFQPIRLQGPKCHLVERKLGDGAPGHHLFGMIPDVHLTSREAGQPPLILDTKYKLLDAAGGGKEGVSQADLYQMYAYSRKYNCPSVVLLYPQAPGASKRDVCFEFEAGARVFVRTVDLSRPLPAGQEELRAELRACLATDPTAWA